MGRGGRGAGGGGRGGRGGRGAAQAEDVAASLQGVSLDPLSGKAAPVPVWQQQLGAGQPAAGGGPAAKPNEPPSAGPPALVPASTGQQGAAPEGNYGQEELRIDSSDGEAYPRSSFLEVYGGTTEWDRAKPAPRGWGASSAAAAPPQASGGPPAPASAQALEAPASTTQCVKECGFFGSPATGGMCSKCFDATSQPPPQPPPHAAPPSRAAPEELRIDSSDGQAYPRSSFLEVYGDTVEWDRAKPAPPAPRGWGVPGAAAAPASNPRPTGSWAAAGGGGGGGGGGGYAAAGGGSGAGAGAAAGPPPPSAAEGERAATALRRASLDELYEVSLLAAPPPRPPRPESFSLLETVKGRKLNVLQGLALHREVLSSLEQQQLLAFVRRMADHGDEGALVNRTYSAPRRWMRGKGRITVQLGCCYNYAADRQGNPPGIMPNEKVAGLPLLLEQVVDRMARRGIFNTATRPDSCIINFYQEGDCIPPHIDHHDFTRPFVTLSLVSEQSILFGPNIKILSEGEFEAPFSMALPVGSVLVLDGAGADICKHCVPGVSEDRISITFRRIDQRRARMTPFKGPWGEQGGGRR